MQKSEPVSFVDAAQYLRKSTVEHQKYSIDNQIAAIERYADDHHYRVVQSYVDAGRSGLTFDNRHELKRLIKDVQSGSASFRAILVYDVSRWGRFQDADEAAYYEYACKRAGIRVVYCAEPFGNDGTPLDTVIKGLKRAMAGEYSRELGVKVYAGQKRIIEQGFRLGALAGYGLRRQLVDPSGKPRGILKVGERKSVSSDRVILVPGPREEIAVVRHIFRTFIKTGKRQTEIARALNRRGLVSSTGAPWNFSSVDRVLTSPKYTGLNVWGRTTAKLGCRPVRIPSDRWIYSPMSSPPIVSRSTFEKAQQKIAAYRVRKTDAEVLASLRKLWRRRGKLTGRLIDKDRTVPSESALTWRFGSLSETYRLIGFEPPADLAFVEVNRRIKRLRDEIIDKIRTLFVNRGDRVVVSRGRFPTIQLNNTTTLQVFVMRCRINQWGNPRWRIRFDNGVPGPAFAVCMGTTNEEPIAFYFFGEGKRVRNRANMHEKDLVPLEPYKITKLGDLWSLV